MSMFTRLIITVATLLRVEKCTCDCVIFIKNPVSKHIVPDWSDVVKEKHEVARDAFLDLVSVDADI